MASADTSINPILTSLPEGDSISSFPSIVEPDLRAKLQRELGLNDDQLNAWLAMADGNKSDDFLSSVEFDAANKETLNALQKSGPLSNLARELVVVRAPVAMMSEVSNPSNWQKEEYIGPGAMAVNAFIQPSATATLPLDNLDPPLDPNTLSLDALVMSILTQRAEIIEVQLREQIASIQQKNKELETANVWLTRAKDKKAALGTSNWNDFGPEFVKYWKSLGAEYSTRDRDPLHQGLQHTSADWDVDIEGLKGKIEALTSQSQLETTKLQQTINKYNQSFEMLSNFINKYYQSLNAVIQNLR
ncbi:MAG: hypothetical protein QS748_02745 [Candidatus Endonucleobacter bathymodioli]|uniref:Uncharacterized protein n=1 Tax=Candidatus Endonucleibacter bathymodioli TaxID=539814 RepID=A0AA90SS19_9GAMM|nr:hypothetical protein [Candidatus Endonucleobacter bathymodioli]